MHQWNEYELDNRSTEELRDRLKELSLSYTPEWNFNQIEPDIGSVIALLFTAQMEENRRYYNLLLQRYRVELANMLGISLQPAKPSKSIVVMENSQVMQGGAFVKKGTKLLGEDENGNEVIFETEKEVYISNTRITELIEISGIHKKAILLWEEGRKSFSIPLFSFSGDSAECEELIISHELIKELHRKRIGLRFRGDIEEEELVELFSDTQKYQFIFRQNGKEILFQKISKEENRLWLERPLQEIEWRAEEKENPAEIIMRRMEGGKEGIVLNAISILGDSDTLNPDFLYDGKAELEIDNIYPFGHEIMAYAEFFIGQESAFIKRGAAITISFELSFENNRLFLVPPDEELKIIKRRPRELYQQNPVQCSIQEVIVEYFNGTGWKKITSHTDYKSIFAEEKNAGEQEITFEAPKDWEEIAIGSYEGPCIRMSIIRADNCYIRPGIHLCPILKNMKIFYTYQEKELLPQKIYRRHGKTIEDITDAIKEKKHTLVFKAFPYENNALYLAFSDKWEEGPVSLFFELRSDNNFSGSTFRFEYSSMKGFKPLKVVDQTEGFRHTGTILFQPPRDMKRVSIEGRERYWIRITEEEGIFDAKKHLFPIMKDFHVNGVEVHNVETKEMQEYFIDTPTANMRFPLYAENILDAQVWVNEKDSYSNDEMNRFLEENSDTTQAEYNFLGEIQEFYRKWEETDNFYKCEKGEGKYRIDRIKNQIVFGDGIQTRIPKNTTGTAFKVTVRCCMGSRGNVEAGKINSFLGNVMFVENVYNTIPAFGGSDLESIPHALKRSSNLISGRKRLVSEQDFLAETLSFSDTVEQVKCISQPEKITLILLMKDYQKGSYSFRTLEPELRGHILSCCEAVLSAESLEIIEPIYAAVSLDIWLVADNMAETFFVQNTWKDAIKEYFEPIEGRRKNGWKIGMLPNEKQIRMMLKSLEKNVYVEKFSISVVYRDEKGFHETDLRQMEGNPRVVCCNGIHNIHMRKKEE